MPYLPSRLTDDLARAAYEDVLTRLPEGLDPQILADEIAAYRATPDDFASDAPRRATASADRYGIARNRLLPGEIGAIHHDELGTFTTDTHLAFLAGRRRAAEVHGIAWAVWSFSGKMATTFPGAPDRTTKPGICAALGLAGCAPEPQTSPHDQIGKDRPRTVMPL